MHVRDNWVEAKLGHFDKYKTDHPLKNSQSYSADAQPLCSNPCRAMIARCSWHGLSMFNKISMGQLQSIESI